MIRRMIVLLLRGYQIVLSPLFGDCCRFHPSCSAYCIEALNTHGCIKGLWLGFLRVGKCHPFHPGGVDPVPLAKGDSVAAASDKASGRGKSR